MSNIKGDTSHTKERKKMSKHNTLEETRKEFEKRFTKHGMVYRFNRNKGETEFWEFSEFWQFISQQISIAEERGMQWNRPEILEAKLKEVEEKTIKRGQDEFKLYLKLSKNDIKKQKIEDITKAIEWLEEHKYIPGTETLETYTANPLILELRVLLDKIG
jgi:hypothetical protein